MRALRMARAEAPALGPLPAVTRDDRALLDDLPFDVESDMGDLGAVTLILGNRSNDLQGNEPDDLDRLAIVHGDPANQAPHCLRRPDEDGQQGLEQAVADCREYVRDQTLAALDGLIGGVPDVAVRTQADIFLELRGAVEAPLPLFYFRIGKALHAVQDSFSHAYRTSDQLHIVTPLNYVEWAEEELVESRDGPAHRSELDRCKDLDQLRRERLGVAIDASADLLRIAVGPEAERAQALDQFFATYISACDATNAYCGNGVPCDAANGWCNAPESAYAESRGCVCSAAGRPGGATSLGALGLGLGALVLIGRRRRLASVLSVLVAGSAARARAQEPEAVPPPAETTAAPAEPEPPPDAEPAPAAPPQDPEQAPVAVDASATSGPVVDATPVSPQRRPFPFGAAANFSAAIENPALAFALGARLRLSDNWLVGLDGEYNPWISFQHEELRSGTVNVYATGVLRFPLAFQRVNLRTTLQFGVSRQMFDLFGVPEGSIGPYFGINVLGLDVELTESVYLIVNPAHIAVPVPQTSGVPFAYPQYRFTLGVQFGA